jgi:4-hydroxybenzoate polyprenyltransferase
MALGTDVRGLALSCHPIPSLAVTAMTAGLAALAGLPVGRAAWVTGTIFVGQLSIGWSNDYLDAERDKASNRADKPLAVGALNRRLVGIAAVVALMVTAAMSVFIGWPGGGAAVATALCGWAYNLGVKATILSWLPYAIAFGSLPAVVTLADLPPRWPPGWAVAAGALIGVAAHFANVLPDLTDDVASGVRGLPHRIGARATAFSAAGLLVSACAVVIFGLTGDLNVWSWAGFALSLVIALVAARAAYHDPSSPTFFRATILIAGIVLLSFAVAGVAI